MNARYRECFWQGRLARRRGSKRYDLPTFLLLEKDAERLERAWKDGWDREGER